MPQMNKGGKFVFGLSLLRDDLTIHIPPQAMNEYGLGLENKVYLISGSKKTGGFVITRKGLLYDSKIGNILRDTPALCYYQLQEGEMIKYKGRYYCWTEITGSGSILLTEAIMTQFSLEKGMKLLSIRSSNIAFTMGAKGPLLEKAAQYTGCIEQF